MRKLSEIDWVNPSDNCRWFLTESQSRWQKTWDGAPHVNRASPAILENVSIDRSGFVPGLISSPTSAWDYIACGGKNEKKARCPNRASCQRGHCRCSDKRRTRKSLSACEAAERRRRVLHNGRRPEPAGSDRRCQGNLR